MPTKDLDNLKVILNNLFGSYVEDKPIKAQ